MKLIGKLKKQVESSATREEAREAIRNAGMELTEDELNMVSGGRRFVSGNVALFKTDGNDQQQGKNYN